MLYRLAHFFQNHLRFLWSLLERINSLIFVLLYGRKLNRITLILNQYENVFAVTLNDVDELEHFFSSQPEESFTFFRPHGFDSKTIRRLVNNPSFLTFLVRDETHSIVGYFFLRSFFIGKTYLGKMVDVCSQGKGIGKQICCCAMDIATALGLRMFETISKDNLASLYSSQNVLEVKILEELDNNYLYIEDIRKKG